MQFRMDNETDSMQVVGLVGIDPRFVSVVDLTRLCIAVCGLMSNCVLVTMYFKYPLLNTHANLFLFNLAITDISSLLYDLFIIGPRQLQLSFVSDIPCWVDSVGVVLPAVSITQVCAIAAERSLFICSPLHYHDIMFKWKNAAIFVSWSLLLLLPRDNGVC